MTAPQHAAPRRRWHVLAWLLSLATSLRAVRAGIELRLAWWDWPAVQAHWHRQYKRADRKAFAAEMAELAARDDAEAHVAGMTPPRESTAGEALDAILDDLAAAMLAPTDAAPIPPGAAPLPLPDPPVSPGQGQHPYRDTWVISEPPPGSPLGWTPVLAVRRDGLVTVDGHGHVEVQAAAAGHALRTLTAPNPVLDNDTRPLRMVPAVPIVRPWLALVGPEDGDRRFVATDPAEWIRDRNRRAA